MPSHDVLCLFDIDGTLLDTGGAGMASLRQTAHQVFGDPGPELDLAGATDLAIIESVFHHFNQPTTPDAVQLYLDTYHQQLDQNLKNQQFTGTLLAGVVPLLEELAQLPNVHLGLLTGNTQVGASIKLRHYGISEFFAFGAFGCDHADRNRLGPIAMQRAQQALGIEIAANQTWIIGDTPKDIACAKAAGVRCLAVATGQYRFEQLITYGADLTLPSLESITPFWE